jgi:hypothetical protein
VSVAQRLTCSTEAMHPSSAFSFVTSEILMTDQHYATLDRLYAQRGVAAVTGVSVPNRAVPTGDRPEYLSEWSEQLR